MHSIRDLEAVKLSSKLFESALWTKSSKECLEEVDKVEKASERRELWSLQMIDSSTKLPNGILTGNLIDLGSYDECLQISSPVKGKHCLANWYLAYGAAENTTNVSMTWSYCMPSSCTGKDIQNVLNDYLFHGHGNLTVLDSDCHVNSSKTLSTADILSISIYAIFLFCCLLSTAYDLMRRNRRKEIFAAFSFYSNGRRLLSAPKSADSLAPLYGLRFLSITWILLGHRYLWTSLSSVMNLAEMIKTFDSLQFQLIGGATLAVDTFFILSSFLNAYHLLRLLDKTRKFPLIKYYVHRYLRTTPALAAFILSQVGWYNLLGDGPLWDRTVGINKQLCEQYWWPTLLYINNYYNPSMQCAGQSWYLAVDMQLYWLTPLVILPCWKWPKLTKYYLGFLLALSTAGEFAIAYVNKIKVPFTNLLNYDEYLRVTETVYTPTHARATPYIMGIIFGFFIVSLKKINKNIILPHGAVAAGWLVSTALCLTVILGNYPLEQPEPSHPYNRLESSFYIGLFRVAWSCGIIWIIFACLYGYGGVINSILSWEPFVPLSRLTYCIYLCHMAIQQYQLGTIRTGSYFQDFELLHRFFGDLICVILVSTVMSLMFESPFPVIEKYIVNRLQRQPQSEGNNNDAYNDFDDKDIVSE